jgi:7,8-dihydroneopterin aldolase/epimerase/oxygenase
LPSDRIVLKGIQFYGFHGANPEERALGQSYLVDLAVELDLSKAGETDRLPDTVSYTHLYRTVKAVLEGESKNLLEAIAHSIASQVLEAFPVSAVWVTMKKPHPPIQGSAIDYAAVEVYRTRE